MWFRVGALGCTGLNGLQTEVNCVWVSSVLAALGGAPSALYLTLLPLAEPDRDPVL